LSQIPQIDSDYIRHEISYEYNHAKTTAKISKLCLLFNEETWSPQRCARTHAQQFIIQIYNNVIRTDL